MHRIALGLLCAIRLAHGAAAAPPAERSVQEIAPESIAGDLEQKARLLERHPEDATANLDYGRLINKPGKLDLARRHLLKALALLPDDPEVHHQLGLNFAFRRAWPEALAELRDAVRMDGRNPVFHFDLAAAYYNSGAFGEAEGEFRKAALLDRGRFEFQFGLAASLEAQKKIFESEPEFLALVERHGDRAIGQYAYASVLLQLDKRDDAKRRVQVALSLDRTLADAHYLLGKILEKEGAVEPAAAAYGRAVELQPGHRNAHYRLAAMYRREGKLDAARAEAETFRHLQAALDARNSLEFGIGSLAAGHLDIARAQFQTALENLPDDPRILYFNGLVSEKEGRNETALEFYGKALALRPGIGLVQAHMGDLLAQLGRNEDARDALRRAGESGGSDFEALETAGRGWMRLGDYAESESALRKALDLWPEQPRALMAMFQLYVLWNKEAVARVYAERAARANSRSPRVLERLALFWTAEGEPEKARELSATVKRLQQP